MSRFNQIGLDKLQNRPIVIGSYLNNRTPPEGACDTRRGLTHHAGKISKGAGRDPTSTLSGRQLLISAIDDFYFPLAW
jgi:hypothetical protein